MAGTKTSMHGRHADGKASPAAPASTEMARRGAGPRPLGVLLAPLLRPAFSKRAPAIAQLAADWPAIVGPHLAAQTTPRRLAAGTLTLACAGTVALELQHSGPALIERINTHLGRDAIKRLRFAQNLLPPLARALPAGDPAIAAAVEARLDGLPASELRSALAALGRAIHAAGQR